MKTTRIRKAITAIAALALALSFVAIEAPTSDASPLHGITFLKGCESPTTVGQKTKCNFTVANSIDPDILTITGIRDVVHAAGGDDIAANILSQLNFTATGGAFCNVGQTLCTLPPGGKLVTATPFAFHKTTGADADNANPLTDDATLTWQDSCSGHEDNCPVGNQSATSGSQTLIKKLPSSTTTFIHNAQHQVVTAVQAGTVVHDLVIVEGPAGGPVPTGNVTVDWFTNGDCSGTPNSTSAPTPLNSNGRV